MIPERISWFSTIPEQVQLVIHNIRNGWLGLLVLIVAVLYIGDINYTSLQAWGFVGAVIAIGHGLLVNAFLYWDKRGEITNYQWWGWAVAIYSLVAGGMVSIGACLAVDEQMVGWNYFLVALIIMPGFGSAVTSTAFLWIHVCWVLGTILPLGTYLLTLNDEIFFALGLLMIVAALPMMVILGVGYARMYNRNILLQLQNVDLVKALEEKVKVANDANLSKSRFLAAASHDLRQPHQALGLFVEALDHMEIEPQKKEILGKTKQAFHAMSALLDQLLDISKLDSANIEAEKQNILLQPLLHQVVMEHMGEAEKKGIELRLRPTQAVVHTDISMLTRIVSNLVTNAIRYTQSGGVLVGVRKKDGQPWLHVWDTGCGIADDKMDYVFQEFSQLDNPERDREKGLGLGLAIVQRLVKILDVDLKVVSRPSQGSCFLVRLEPVREDKRMAEAIQNHNDKDVCGLCMVVIDDDKIASEGIQTLLDVWGCKVKVFSSLEACLSSLAEAKSCPDVIIADYRLRNQKTGIVAIESIRVFCKKPVPALIITGDTDTTVIDEAQEHDIPLLHKPVDPQTLKSFLADVKASRL